MSPSRDHSQVSIDKNTAETTGETTCGSIKDLLSTTDTKGESVSYSWLEGGCQIDDKVIRDIGDPNYVGPEGLGWTMFGLYKQIRAVKQMYDADGRLLQPPSILFGEKASCEVLAAAEQWWATQWEKVLAMPEHTEGGYIDGNRRVFTVYIMASKQEACLEEQQQKQQKQAQQAQGKNKQKRACEPAQYAPSKDLRSIWASKQPEEAIQEPTAWDIAFEQAIEREANLRTKKGAEGEICRSDAPEMVRILVLLAEQTQHFKTKGLTCTECGTTTTMDMQNADRQQDISIYCSKCKMSLVQCKTMESADQQNSLNARTNWSKSNIRQLAT